MALVTPARQQPSWGKTAEAFAALRRREVRGKAVLTIG
jgi:hypothetical protein